MIFKRLIIENFGIYRGKHDIDLSVTDDKPIILFGGLNGGGKTTFLDALQLVLYGKHAKCSNRGPEGYGAFLAGTKNRFADPQAQTTLALTFSHRTENQSRDFTVERTWQVKETSETKDKIMVLCNGIHDKHLSQYWDEFVNEFIPLSLSDLFFFDGEKIENLAHPDRSADLVKTGIENLLGLDLLSQLHIDLSLIERKRKKENVDKSIITKVNDCENEIGKQTAIVAELQKDKAELAKKARNATVAVNRAAQAVRVAGADHIENREQIKFALGGIKSKIKATSKEQVSLAAGVGPLGLVSNLISETKAQINLEKEAIQAQALNRAIVEYESRLLQSMAATDIPLDSSNQIKNTMQSLSKERAKLADVECYINADIGIFNGLDDRIETESEQAQQLSKLSIELHESLALKEKDLESVPEGGKVINLLSSLQFAEKMRDDINAQLEAIEPKLEQAQLRSDTLATRYSTLLSQQSKDTFEQKRAVQVAEHIDKLKQTLQSFGQQLISENIVRLEKLIKAKFTSLGRKELLISKLSIAPASFEITLYDADGGALAPSKLSAGERQLLSIAILWGLAEASGKEIPTVIDTPLGRLDGQHRTKLVNNYFPHASQQVILLSTDEEINGQYYEQLKPSICREYKINFNEQEKSSSFEKGYF
ncbi:MAG: DNA sulfur modification protein DndD [Algicola sp.]|nr:DNA sulfur modification protein DndD [Algicola sp.]